jgi:Flp pilus assembly protein TadB
MMDATLGLSLLISTLAALAGGLIGLAVAEAIGARGDSPRQQAPWMDRLRPWLRAAPIPTGLRRRWAGTDVSRRLAMAAIPWTADDFAALRWLGLWGGAAMALAALAWRGFDLFGWFLALVVLAVSWAAPGTWVSLRVERRQRDLERSLPDFLDRLSLALDAGLGFEVALRRSAERFPGRLGEELRRMVRQLDRGHARAEAMEDMAARNPSDDLGAFAASVRQADRLGTSLAVTLRVQSDLSRNRRRRRAQEAGRRLPVLIVFPLVFFFLPALLIVYLAPPLLHLFLGQ